MSLFLVQASKVVLAEIVKVIRCACGAHTYHQMFAFGVTPGHSKYCCGWSDPEGMSARHMRFQAAIQLQMHQSAESPTMRVAC